MELRDREGGGWGQASRGSAHTERSLLLIPEAVGASEAGAGELVLKDPVAIMWDQRGGRGSGADAKVQQHFSG